MCGHCARRRSAGSATAHQRSKQEAAKASAQVANEPTPWSDRSVSLSELSEVLGVAGCGRQQNLAPLVEITQGPEGTSFVTVAALGDTDSHSLGALEIIDPTAVAEETRTVEINGRSLHDAINGHSAAERRALALSDISISGGAVSIGNAEAIGTDNEARLVADAHERIDQIRSGAIAAGSSMESFLDGIVHPQMREQGLIDYEQWAQDRKAYWRKSLPAMVPDSESEFDREIRLEYDNEINKLRNRARDQAERMQNNSIRNWAYENGHPWDMLKDLADPRYEIIESDTTHKQRAGLEHAKELLGCVGPVGWEPSVQSGAFRDELRLILPSAGSASGREVLDNVHFGVVDGRHRVTATDSYQLASSSVAAPATLCEKPRLLPTKELDVFVRASDKHLGRGEHSVQLGTSQGSFREPVGERRGEEQRYRDRAAVALQAGQVRVAMAAAPMGGYPKDGLAHMLEHAKESRLVTLAAQDVIDATTGAGRSRGKEHPGDRISLSLRRTGSGTVTGLQWRSQMTQSPEKVGFAKAARSSRASAPGDDTATKISPKRLATALRFAAANSPNVEVRGWPEGINPLAIVPEGAPRAPQDIDRIALVMPQRN